MCDKMPKSQKPKVKIVVQMFGGIIEAVYADSDQVEITDVIFLEDGKYADSDVEAVVDGGQFEGNIIYTHEACQGTLDKEDMDAIVKAAESRRSFTD